MDTKTQVKFVYSEIAQEAIEIGRKHHMPFSVIGYGEIPTRPFFRGKWWFEPAKEAPEKARKQIAVLKASGITFKGYLVAHEIELIEKKEEKTDFKIIQSSIPPTQKSGSDFLASALKFTFTAGLVMFAMLPMALIDPVIIGVCEDGTWLSILTYYK